VQQIVVKAFWHLTGAIEGRILRIPEHSGAEQTFVTRPYPSLFNRLLRTLQQIPAPGRHQRRSGKRCLCRIVKAMFKLSLN
jgi:hypothetical protein